MILNIVQIWHRPHHLKVRWSMTTLIFLNFHILKPESAKKELSINFGIDRYHLNTLWAFDLISPINPSRGHIWVIDAIELRKRFKSKTKSEKTWRSSLFINKRNCYKCVWARALYIAGKKNYKDKRKQGINYSELKGHWKTLIALLATEAESSSFPPDSPMPASRGSLIDYSTSPPPLSASWVC